MKRIIKVFIVGLSLTIMNVGLNKQEVFGQDKMDKATFLKEMSELKESFFKGGNVSFDMTYYYSNEGLIKLINLFIQQGRRHLAKGI